MKRYSKQLFWILALTLCLTGCQSAAPTASGTSPVAQDIEGRYIKRVFEDIEIMNDIQYGTAVNENGKSENLLLDLYQPKGDTAEKRPVVIFAHGGGFSGGDKKGQIEQTLAEILARKGYVTLSINYRLRKTPSTDWIGTYRDATDDAYAAFEWLMKHKDEYRIDEGHIAFGGHSAGSNVVTELCYSDWSGRSFKKDGVFAVISMAGPEMVRGNPKADDPFGIIIHGELDELVPAYLSKTLAERMDRTGTPHALDIIPRCYHNQNPAIGEVEDFVTKYLYQAMTGKDAGIEVRRYASALHKVYTDRLANRPTYSAARIPVVLDGKLDEWGKADKLPLDQLKDSGSALPAPQDCTAIGMAAWDPTEPSCLYAALTVTDDVFQENGNPNFWENDALELLVDLTDGNGASPYMQWVVGVNGKDFNYSQCNPGSCQAVVSRQGNKAVFEVMLDLSKARQDLAGYSLAGKTVGFCLCYDDSEEGARQHQLGLVAGKTLEPKNFANLRFEADTEK